MQYQRIREPDTSVGPAILLGLVLGAAAGFLLGELYAGEGTRRVTRLWKQRRNRSNQWPTAVDLTAELREALAATLGSDSQKLELVAVGRESLELHGWVSSRRARANALAVGRDLAGPARQIIDRLLVSGEDDQPTAEPVAAEEA